MVTIEASSHGEAAEHPASIRAAGTTDTQPRTNVATTSHTGSGRARSKRRTKQRHAKDSQKGETAHAVARPHRDGSAPADPRRSGGSTGDRSKSLERLALVYEAMS